MKQQLTPLQIAISIAVFVCVAVAVGVMFMNRMPSVPTAAVIPPPAAKLTAPAPVDKSNQIVGPVASGPAWVAPSRSASVSVTTNGAPPQPAGGPPPPGAFPGAPPADAFPGAPPRQ